MELGTLIERLRSADVDSMSVAEVAMAMRDVARVESCTAGLAARLASRADELAVGGRGSPGVEALGADRRMSRRDAARSARRGEALRSLPQMARLLAKGRIGSAHVGVVAAAAQRVGAATRDALLGHDGQMATKAAGLRPEEFRRYVDRLVDRLRPDVRRERAVRQRNSVRLTRGIDHDSGMYWLRGEFDPETGARVFDALDAEIAARCTAASRESSEVDPAEAFGVVHERIAAEALADLLTSANRSRRPGRVEASVLIDFATLTSGLHGSSVCELGDGRPRATAPTVTC